MISLSLDLRGVKELMAKNARFPRVLSRGVVNSLRRTLRRTATATMKDVRSQSGIGRTIWGKNAGGLRKQGLVTIIKPRVGENAIETGLRLRGIPGLLERGGRLKAHKIRGKTERGLLVFEGRSGLVFTGSVKHPGAAVRAHGFGGSNIRRNESLIAQDVNASIRKAVEQVYGQ